jgi:hypothetical protein
MKRLSVVGLFVWILFGLQAGVIDVWGNIKQIDTLEHRLVGPGIQYTRFRLPEYPLSGYMLTVDLNNPNNLVETFQAQEQVAKTEAMTAAFQRLSHEGHQAIAGVNGNFWIVSGQGQPTEVLGTPHSGSMKSGELVTDPNNWNRGRSPAGEPDIGFVMIDADKELWIDDIQFTAQVTIPEIGSYAISQINRLRGNNQLVMFNSYIGAQATRSDNNGTEVFVRLADNASWGVNKDVQCEVVRISKNEGANLLAEGEIALSGNGNAQTFLDNLAIGDGLTIHMTVETISDKQYPNITDMITGNALVMKNGELTPRNFNEDYNTMLYPRTGIASSANKKTLYLIVIDKMTKSVGATTETMCGILKACGAADAASMDGGGSAQMMLDGTIVNDPADGRERPVANGWFLFHTAPEDEVITAIDFEAHSIKVPAFSSFTPTILGFNQYGVLVDQQVVNFQLSCDASLGSIDNNQTFVANGTATHGVLTAEFNGASVSQTIEIVAGNLSFRLDSVLIDNHIAYPIEVMSIFEDQSMAVDPKHLNWEVADETICVVEDGVLKGINNGRTIISGNLGTFNNEIVVNVEIPNHPTLIGEDFETDWTLSASSFLKANLNQENLPANWEHGAAVNFVHAAGRSPYIKLTGNPQFYSIPDTIKLVMHIGNIDISRAILTFKSNFGNSSSIEFNDLIKQQEFSLSVPVDAIYDANDVGIYPLSFDNIHCYMNASGMQAGEAYTMALKEFLLCYPHIELSQVITHQAKQFAVYPNPVSNGELFISLKDYDTSAVNIRLLNTAGQEIYHRMEHIGASGITRIPVGNLSTGNYILQIEQAGTIESTKIIIK